MKKGRFFPIPERPADLGAIWAEATRLVDGNRPRWLTADDAEEFRLAGTISLAGADASIRRDAEAEFGRLELARLIVSDDERDADRRQVFVRRPVAEPIWSIGLRSGPTPLDLRPPSGDAAVLVPEDVTDVPASSVADPFLIRRDGQWQMFMEVVNWQSWKGEIGLATSPDGFRWKYEQIVLAEPFHCSYPLVFESKGDIWMVPETSQSEAVRLYRARRFPDDWEHVADLLTGLPFADATLFEHDGGWWLAVETSGGRHDTLRLYAAARLDGPWREHPASPVIQGDARIARPAGRLVTWNGRLMRPAQSSQPAYGTDVRLMEIGRLDAVNYEERVGGPGPVLGPTGIGWNAAGMHHLDLHQRPDGSWLAAVDGWRIEEQP